MVRIIEWPDGENKSLIVEVEVHRGVVDAGGLVDVDVEAVVGLHLQRRLHTRGREDGDRGVVPVDYF